jgi:metal-responsive CopG/Arc/MetJ family transcriptional regulator
MARTAVTIGFSVPPELAAEVDRLALEQGWSRSALFRDMLRLYREQVELRVLEDLTEYGSSHSTGRARSGAAGVAPLETERVAVTLPATLVAEVDRLAALSGLTRSALIREASASYVAARKEQDRKRTLLEATEDLLSFLEEIKGAPALDARPTLEILRELRGPLDDDVRGYEE